jgi:hypothetical protein
VGKSESRGYGRRQCIETQKARLRGRGVTGLGANASGEARGNGPLGFAGVAAVQARLRRSGAPLRLLHLTPTRCPLSR